MYVCAEPLAGIIAVLAFAAIAPTKAHKTDKVDNEGKVVNEAAKAATESEEVTA